MEGYIVRIFGVDEFGKPVKRTKMKYPYSYDGFITFRDGANSEVNCTVYSDRILHEPRYNELCKKHFGNEGQMFFDRSPKDIEAFLQDFLGYPKLKVIFIMEYCNVSSGFPLWRFDVNTNLK